jgi:hypothetical protein
MSERLMHSGGGMVSLAACLVILWVVLGSVRLAWAFNGTGLMYVCMCRIGLRREGEEVMNCGHYFGFCLTVTVIVIVM